jgi:hypothetical protein
MRLHIETKSTEWANWKPVLNSRELELADQVLTLDQ